MDSRKQGICIISLVMNLLVFLNFGRKQSSNAYSFIYLPMLILVFLSAFCMLNVNYDEHIVMAHSIFGGSNNNGTQIQQNGNFVVDLFVNPQNPLINKNTDIFLRFTSKAGDELIELPVSINLLKDGQANKNTNNYVIIQQGHYNFNYKFTEPGKYLLYVNVKDIFYTHSVLNFIFVINVDISIPEKISGFLFYFAINYYYYYVPIGILIAIVVIMRLYKKKKSQIKENKM